MKKSPFPYYPFLLAIYPVLHVYSRNTQLVTPGEIIRPVTVCLALAAVALIAGQLLLRNRVKAGIWASVFVVLFLSYGFMLACVARVMVRFQVNWHPASHTVAALIVLLAALALLAVLLARTKRPLTSLAQFLTVMSIVAPALALIHIGMVAASAGAARGANSDGWGKWIAQQREEARDLHPAPGKPKPDIYYIILDMYGANDSLREYYGFDNSAFTNNLTKRGFYVPAHSRCNYACTQFSLPSGLNYDYMDNLLRESKDEALDKYGAKAIVNNRLARILQDNGYKYVFLRSTCGISNNCPYADIEPNNGAIRYSELERVLVQKSVLDLIRISNVDVAVRDQTLWQLDELGRIPKIGAPTFTYAHMICPHDPWVFDRNGNMPKETVTRTPETTRDAYIEQMQYLNGKVLKMIDKILAGSRTPPIIVIQGDHGPLDAQQLAKWLRTGDVRDSDGKLKLNMKPRVGILNAHYFPGEEKKDLYDTITPVNTWRIVLNHYFGAHLELLEDKTYVPTWGWTTGAAFRLDDFVLYVDPKQRAKP